MNESLHKFKAEIFQALAHPTRIAIVEKLRAEGEVPAHRFFEELHIEPANASQHLAVLRASWIVTSRKEGSQVFYSIRDPLLFEVLDILRRYFEIHLEEALSVLSELKTQTAASAQPTAGTATPAPGGNKAGAGAEGGS
jgi:ArsR family transcriptional regulator